MRVGDIPLHTENSNMATDIIGYYPLYLYSKKVNVIPESLGKSTLPSILLKKDESLEPYIKYMGSNLNMDSISQHFILDNTHFRLDVPENWFTFHLYFDIITRRKD